jgi:hypothetical protein
MVVAAAIMACVAWLCWNAVDRLLGRSLIAQILSVGLGLSVGGAAYAGVLLACRLPEATQIAVILRRRLVS